MEIVADTNEGGFVASYPDLPGCITCGETRFDDLCIRTAFEGNVPILFLD